MKRRTRTSDMICVLADIRDQSRPASIQVWSYDAGRVVNLPRSQIQFKTGKVSRWAAISVPRWLAAREQLLGRRNPDTPMSGFCREFCTDMRTPKMIREDGERSLAETVIEIQNRDVKLPGQRYSYGGGMGRLSNVGT